MTINRFVALTVCATLTACGGGGSGSSSSPIVQIPTTTTPPPAPTPPPPPPATSTNAKFSAPQKIEGIQIAIPYTEVDFKWTMDFTIESFYVVGNRISFLRSFFPQNVTKPDVYGEEFAYTLTSNSSSTFATKASSIVSTSHPADMIETSLSDDLTC